MHEGNILQKAAKKSTLGIAGLSKALGLARSNLYYHLSKPELSDDIKARAAEALGTTIELLFVEPEPEPNYSANPAPIVVVNVNKNESAPAALTGVFIFDEPTGLYTAFFAESPFLVATGKDISEAEANLFKELAISTREPQAGVEDQKFITHKYILTV